MEASHANRSDGLLDPALLRKLERLAIAAKKVRLGKSKGERRSKRKGSSAEFADYRDYVQGDDLRHVDWNIYSRLGALYLKLFEDQEDLTLHLLLDTSQSMAFGTPHKLEFAKKLAAATGYVGLVGYDRVVASAFSGESFQGLRPVRGKASAGKLFSFLAGLEASGGTQLAERFRTHTVRQRSKGVALLLSDFFDEAGFEEALKRAAASGSEVYAVQVLAPEELDPQLSGVLRLVDSETGGFVEVSVSRALMKRYEKTRDSFLERVRQYCLGRGIGHFVVSSATPVEHLVLELLRQGGMVR